MRRFILLFLITSIITILYHDIAFSSSSNDYVKVIYFHGKNRCYTCKLIEEYTKEAVETIFEEDIKKGKVKLEVINFDEPKNKHYIKKYNLYTQTLIMVRYQKAKEVEYKNCEKIWVNVKNKVTFFNYIESEVSSYLKAL